MKSVPTLLAVIAIGASGFAIPPKPAPNRADAIPLPKPIPITIDELALSGDRTKGFEESQIPEAAKRLNGKRVQIVGQMSEINGPLPLTTFNFSGYTEHPNFLALSVQHFIPVTMKQGTTTPAGIRPIEVEGRFVIRPVYVGNKLTFLYAVEDATVRDSECPDGFHMSVLPIFRC